MQHACVDLLLLKCLIIFMVQFLMSPKLLFLFYRPKMAVCLYCLKVNQLTNYGAKEIENAKLD